MQVLQLCRCRNDIISGNWVFKRAALRKRNLETRMKEKENWESSYINEIKNIRGVYFLFITGTNHS